MLIENTLFGVRDKVAEAIALLQSNVPPEGYYVCFSGGKDSVVAYDLVKKAGVPFEVYHNVTTVEPPELRKFIRDFYPEVTDIHPKLSMYQLIIKKKFPPLREFRYCCKYMKENQGTNRVKVTGIRAAESPRRAKRDFIEPNRWNSQGGYVHPIKSFSDSDVWQYIHENNLPYCSLYDEGFHRIGCVLCPFISYEQTFIELKRWPALADYYRRALRRVYELRIQEGKFLHKDWSSPEAMFEWWIESRKRHRVAKDCASIPLFSEDDGSIL